MQDVEGSVRVSLFDDTRNIDLAGAYVFISIRYLAESCGWVWQTLGYHLNIDVVLWKASVSSSGGSAR